MYRYLTFVTLVLNKSQVNSSLYSWLTNDPHNLGPDTPRSTRDSPKLPGVPTLYAVIKRARAERK